MPKKQWVQTTEMKYKKRPVKDRFYSKIRKGDVTGCWNWTASKRKARGGFVYGQFSLNGYPEWSHRASWIIHNNEIPNGMLVCHKCDNTLCVNPDHLFLGTQTDNIRDMISKGRDALIGENNPHSIVNEKIVLEIRRYYKEGHKVSRIMKKFNLKRGCVEPIIKRNTWKHI